MSPDTIRRIGSTTILVVLFIVIVLTASSLKRNKAILNTATAENTETFKHIAALSNALHELRAEIDKLKPPPKWSDNIADNPTANGAYMPNSNHWQFIWRGTNFGKPIAVPLPGVTNCITNSLGIWVLCSEWLMLEQHHP